MAPPKWITPPSGVLKLSIYGVWNDITKRDGFGCVIHTDSSSFVVARYGSINNVLSPVQAEVLAACLAVVWVSEIRYQNILFECDSLQIMDSLRDPSTNISFIGQILEDIKAFLPTITGASFAHFRRQANEIALRLGQSPSSIIWDLLEVEASLN
ncbi:hypothetical protein D8674_010114 [Pyrus ussuriensis x Pyrus communis]|uniref:RNase H type-1 domain-containing protein n=1 Tax=Pyrus ussuriensis x Pyrus communis TaxID=2448454 RepID=A0A5N5FAK7_9ROSA|nr:hypothetical protein D8674_010114 [Pyrus ussuriensis x Pyrus communis]